MNNEKCPLCRIDLIELGTNEEYVCTTYQEQTYTQWTRYGYWCTFCKKMYVKKQKSWLEPWKYGEDKNEDRSK